MWKPVYQKDVKIAARFLNHAQKYKFNDKYTVIYASNCAVSPMLLSTKQLSQTLYCKSTRMERGSS